MAVAAPHAGREHATCSPTSSVLDPLSGNAVLNGIPVTVESLVTAST